MALLIHSFAKWLGSNFYIVNEGQKAVLETNDRIKSTYNINVREVNEIIDIKKYVNEEEKYKVIIRPKMVN